MKTALVVAVLVVAVGARAQEYRQAQAHAAEQAYQDMICAQADSARAAAQSGRVRSRTIDSTLTAMNDGPEAGGRVVAYLEAQKLSVYAQTQRDPVKFAYVNGQPAVLLSDALPAHPRVYGPLIAVAAAARMYADMPATGEREYMVMATAARVFAELGGDFNALPKIDGDDAPDVKELVSWWTGGVEATVDALAHRANLPTIPELQSAAKGPKEAAALQAADKRFVSFLLDEKDARAAAGLR